VKGACIRCVQLSWASEENERLEWCGRIWELCRRRSGFVRYGL